MGDVQRHLFGTDGIRGKANSWPMTVELAVAFGRAVARHFQTGTERCTVVIGKDTRISGDMLAHGVAAGLCSMGADVVLAGVIPTPAVAYLAASMASVAAGVMISASHNPFEDNGLKLFDGQGFKLSDDQEAQVEKWILDEAQTTVCESIREMGRVSVLSDAGKRYRSFLKQSLPDRFNLKGIRIVLDCANGATCEVAPELFSELGAQVKSLFIHPDGKNINVDCGSQHTETLRRAVTEAGAHIGLAFDGDGDRLIAVDDRGQQVDGDTILAICAHYMKQTGTLAHPVVVSTVMSNFGLGEALKQMGISHERTDVGDRYVLERMKATGAVIGGEDSGHMIFLDHHTTGDGMMAALRLLQAMKHSGQPLSQLVSIMPRYPQELINVPVTSKPDIRSIPEIADTIDAVEKSLGASGDVLVRYSGTRQVCRVLVKGTDPQRVKTSCQTIADAVARALG